VRARCPALERATLCTNARSLPNANVELHGLVVKEGAEFSEMPNRQKQQNIWTHRRTLLPGKDQQREGNGNLFSDGASKVSLQRVP
jgi:hypothetical protein